MDIVFRAIALFFFVWLVTRAVGRRELSTLEPFDLILLIVLGDLIQQGVLRTTSPSRAQSWPAGHSR